MMHALPHRRGQCDLSEGLDFEEINEVDPVRVVVKEWVVSMLVKRSVCHVTDDVKPTFLDVIHKLHERDGGTRVGDHQKDLRTPELDVIFTAVQHQQVFPHLVKI